MEQSLVPWGEKEEAQPKGCVSLRSTVETCRNMWYHDRRNIGKRRAFL